MTSLTGTTLPVHFDGAVNIGFREDSVTWREYNYVVTPGSKAMFLFVDAELELVYLAP